MSSTFFNIFFKKPPAPLARPLGQVDRKGYTFIPYLFPYFRRMTFWTSSWIIIFVWYEHSSHSTPHSKSSVGISWHWQWWVSSSVTSALKWSSYMAFFLSDNALSLMPLLYYYYRTCQTLSLVFCRKVFLIIIIFFAWQIAFRDVKFAG